MKRKLLVLCLAIIMLMHTGCAVAEVYEYRESKLEQSPTMLPAEQPHIVKETQAGETYCGLSMPDGTVVLDTLCVDYRESPLSFCYSDDTGHWGFYDKASGFLQAPVYDDMHDDVCTNAAYPILVGKDNLYGYADRRTGEIVIPLRYGEYCNYSEFINGYALIYDNYGNAVSRLIDTSGQAVVFPEGIFAAGSVEPSGLVRIRKETDEGYVYGLGNTAGEVVLTPQYQWICDFSYGYAFICQNDRWGYIDSTFHEVVSPRFKINAGTAGRIFFNADGTASFENWESHRITIDTEGNILSDEPSEQFNGDE